ncbi:hypothetical protein [Chryseobacterium sp. JK1]|uniref:hypothetical protein n=1 Tax=Chryseobacterium sp. JK1 TaxID=874294 RepID=UPI003D691507
MKNREVYQDLKLNKSYVFITLNDGISYKRLTSINKKVLTVTADNSFYRPYNIPLDEIVEIWQYASGIFPEDFEPKLIENQNLQEIFHEIQKSIQVLDEKLSKIH